MSPDVQPQEHGASEGKGEEGLVRFGEVTSPPLEQSNAQPQLHSASKDDVEGLVRFGEVTSPPLTEFHLFKKLPAEIRLMVWEMALPGPRLVELRDRATTDLLGSFITFVESTAPIPSLLHVNKESRDVALRVYKLSFEGPESKYAAGVHERGPRVYFNWEIDTIFFGWDSGLDVEGGTKTKDLAVMLLPDGKELKKITRLAIDSDVLSEVGLESLSIGKLTLVVTNLPYLPRNPVLQSKPSSMSVFLGLEGAHAVMESCRDHYRRYGLTEPGIIEVMYFQGE